MCLSAVRVFLVPKTVVAFSAKSHGKALQRLLLSHCDWDWLTADHWQASRNSVTEPSVPENNERKWIKKNWKGKKITKHEWLIRGDKRRIITARGSSSQNLADAQRGKATVHICHRLPSRLIAYRTDNASLSITTYLKFDKLSLLAVCTCVEGVSVIHCMCLCLFLFHSMYVCVVCM